MYPTVPADLSALSVEALRALQADLKAWALTVDQSKLATDPELTAQVRQAGEDRKAINAELSERAATDAALAEALADVAVAEPEATDAPEDEPDDEPDEDPEEDDEDLAATEVTPEDTTPEVEETVAGHAPAVKTGLGVQRIEERIAAAPAKRTSMLSKIEAADRISGLNPGDKFASWTDLSEALLEVGQNVQGASSRYTVARVRTEYPASHVLSEDTRANLALFEPEVMAEMCAPCTPDYSLTGDNTDRRPVLASLPGYNAPRGCASFYPSPSLSDITDGTGIWTRTDDANPNAVKNACQTIECATPEEFFIYGVYRCLTVKNMLAITYPELVQAYLNRLAAAHARLAEIQLLNAMGAEATALDVDAQVYDAPTSLTSTLLTYLALYAELERWDAPSMEVWLHRWVLIAMKMDYVRRRRTDGGVNRIPSDAEINRLFSEAGYNVHWVLDVPTWMTPLPNGMSASGTLHTLPSVVDMLVAPSGKFGVMDKGELRIGVAPGNIYRDNTSNSHNDFTYFFENFEGVVNTNNLPAHILTLPVCFNGRQIGDYAIGAACDGLDESVS